MWQVPRDRAGGAEARERQSAGWLDYVRSLACLLCLHVQSPCAMNAGHQSSQTWGSLQSSTYLRGKRESAREREREEGGKERSSNQVWFKQIEKLNLCLED